MMFGELESYIVLLGNSIFLFPRVVLIVPRSYFKMSIAVSVMCLTRLCVVFCCIVRVVICLGDAIGVCLILQWYKEYPPGR